MYFLDRTEERKLLKGIIDEIKGGENRCIWIEGKSGTGKSYLLKYVITTYNLPVFYFEDYSWQYKCKPDDVDKDYQYIVRIASCFQEQHPREFNSFLINYFKNYNTLTWLEVLALLIPNVKLTQWAKDIINNPLEKIEASQVEISKMLHAPGLKKCFARLILHMLVDIEKKEHVVFCIDDACWLDEESISVLKMILNIVRIEKNNLKISIIVITRTIKELISTKENYKILESDLKDVYNDINYFYINNSNFAHRF